MKLRLEEQYTLRMSAGVAGGGGGGRGRDGKEMNYRQKELPNGSVSVENTGLLKERQLVWLGGEARDVDGVDGSWVWTAWGPMEEHSCFVL